MKDLGEASYVLGIQLIRDRKNKPSALSQASYIDKILVRFSMQNSKKVGSLMYSILCTRPDICFTLGVASRYQSNPRLDHWVAVKHILKSVFTLGGGAIIWRSIKQSCIVDSTMEAEYVAACEAAKQSVWLRKFLSDLEVVPDMDRPMTLYCDNSGAMSNSKEPRSHKRGKHIERKYHLIREIVQGGDVVVTKIASQDNLADPFTKTLMAKVFEGHLEGLRLPDMSHML
ncbi:hypothetical protein JRO89_XS02G0162300 [Xanthoceras sorbifolium]|uniref:Retrovirus-related pol polyprotein from transposon tnt 1-94 n=1 Tax=Xanthoceras sorbifolium TaxID=99658 RepID=A0ABQ8IG60_9ROSI|nr:hypothetical protein JRO89_XS02G0162300 [Xanthoceras sorbifolium]